MMLEVCIFKRRMEAEANHSLRRQPVKGFLGERGHCAYLWAEKKGAEERIQG